MIVQKVFIIFSFIVSVIFSYSQEYFVQYKYYSNGSLVEDLPPLVLKGNGNLVQMMSLYPEYSRQTKEVSFIDYNERKSYQTFVNIENQRYTLTTSFDDYPKPEFTDETMEILGYKCRKAKVVIRSNHIDIWFAEDSGMKGTPALNQGIELGLVLKIVRNGNFEVRAEEIVKTANQIVFLKDWGTVVDAPTYRQLVTQNNFTIIRIFDNEKINFGDTIINPKDDLENITYRFSKGTVIMKKVKLPENANGQSVFAELTTYSNGDAYDRTGTLFVIPQNTEKTLLDALKNGLDKIPKYKSKKGKEYQGPVASEDYEPPLELMRFITPFGVRHYNQQVKVNGIEWEDSVTYKEDVTQLLGTLEGEVWIGVFIGCYDKGGHIVSLNLKYFPDDLNAKEIAEKNFWVKPIINTVNIMEMSGQEYGSMFLDDTLSVTVEIPEGVKNLKIRYITTGHGGWENGDEFNQKMNEIFIDGKKVYSVIPWRTDCGSYRRFNPASGNFPNGLSSSDYSRSGWCPGSTSVVYTIPLENLRAGKHTIKVFIPMGKPEGTSSSAWNVSTVLIGEIVK